MKTKHVSNLIHYLLLQMAARGNGVVLEKDAGQSWTGRRHRLILTDEEGDDEASLEVWEFDETGLMTLVSHTRNLNDHTVEDTVYAVVLMDR